MKRNLLYTIIALVIGTLAIYAANVHFKGEPEITDNGTTLTFCGALAGLGNQNVTITLTTRGFATATCTSPGGNVAPGQNKVPVTSSVSQTIRANEIKNGTVSFCQTTSEPRVGARAAGCPNNNWDADVTDVEFASATLTVVQGGRVVLQETF
jgi:hypothetical protein